MCSIISVLTQWGATLVIQLREREKKNGKNADEKEKVKGEGTGKTERGEGRQIRKGLRLTLKDLRCEPLHLGLFGFLHLWYSQTTPASQTAERRERTAGGASD